MDTLTINSASDILTQKNYDIVIINTYFEIQEIDVPYKQSIGFNYIQDIVNSVSKIIRKNGLIYVYGIPQELIYFGIELNKKFIFKYWTVIDIVRSFEHKDLPHHHVGLLIYSANHDLALLQPSATRIRYKACSNCNQNVKDWGGKKHLMHKEGTAISDIWADFEYEEEFIEDTRVENITLSKIDTTKLKISLNNSQIPELILDRILKISNSDSILNIIMTKNFRPCLTIDSQTLNELPIKSNTNYKYENAILLHDSIDFLEEITSEYPNGYFDLIFADPPYNLEKNYTSHNDGMPSDSYIQWCNKWLSLCAKALKPNGSLFVLNIPKWSVYHAEELNKNLYLKNWITWDALSVPMGKIMPAHYSLLYYVKNPYKYVFNTQLSYERKDLCLRSSCIKSRFSAIQPNKINDIWNDIHRIKHKKDRDEHPCQLPFKLLERIILMSTNEGDIVFDPFCGAGTTPIVAKKLNRRYCSTEISEEYVAIATKNLQTIEEQGVLRKTVSQKKKETVFSKKEIELKIQELTIKYQRKITIEELLAESTLKKEDLLELYGNLSKPFKVASIVL